MFNASKYWDEISRLPIGCALEIKIKFGERFLKGKAVLTHACQPSPEFCYVGTIYLEGILREEESDEVTYTISKIVLSDAFIPFTKMVNVEFYENRMWGSTFQDGKLVSYSVCN